VPLYLWREKGWPLSDQGESLRVLIADDYAGAQRHLDFAIAELREDEACPEPVGKVLVGAERFERSTS